MEIGDGEHRKRCKRWDTPYDAHYLTFSCFGRQPFLQSAWACSLLLQAVNGARAKRPFDLWAYTLMPEHVHMIVWPHEGIRISAILQAVKLPVTIQVLRWVRAHAPVFLDRMADRQPNGVVAHRFWQRGGGYDRNIRDDRELYEKIKYIHDNPVRRDLVTRPEEWRWSSCRIHYYGEPGPIQLQLQSLPPPPLT